jgi:hypothetical protein
VQAIHSRPSYPGENTHALISAILTRRKRRLLLAPRTFPSSI